MKRKIFRSLIFTLTIVGSIWYTYKPPYLFLLLLCILIILSSIWHYIVKTYMTDSSIPMFLFFILGMNIIYYISMDAVIPIWLSIGFLIAFYIIDKVLQYVTK